MSEVNQTAVFTDFNSFTEMRAGARKNSDETIEKVAKQFEGIFLQMALQSMRKANEAFKTDGFFNSDSTEFYNSMYDQQLSLTLAQNKSVGLADVLVRQLSNQHVPSAAISSDKAITSYNKVAEAKDHG